MRIRFDTNPGESLTATGVFPSRRTSSTPAWCAASLVCWPRITSTSSMTGTGLKKWSPSTLSGRRVAEARRVMEMEEGRRLHPRPGPACILGRNPAPRHRPAESLLDGGQRAIGGSRRGVHQQDLEARPREAADEDPEVLAGLPAHAHAP
jgi:hypothetical protein